MWVKKLQYGVITHVRDNSVRYGVVTFLFITAFTAGVFSFGALSAGQRQQASGYVQGFVLSLQMGSLNIPSALLHSFLYNLRIFTMLTLCGLYVAALPFSILAFMAKGFSLGFSVVSILTLMGVPGLALILLCILPANLIIIYCYVRGGVQAIDHAIFCFRNRERGKKPRGRARAQRLWNRHVPYLSDMLTLFFIMLAGMIMESVIAPLAMNAFSAIFY